MPQNLFDNELANDVYDSLKALTERVKGMPGMVCVSTNRSHQFAREGRGDIEIYFRAVIRAGSLETPE